MTVAPVILAIDASAQQCSAALLHRGQILERKHTQARGHASLLLEWVGQMLAEAELPRSAIDALAFGQGPGSFTGVRIASGIAQGLAFGFDRPVIALSSLQLLAEQAAALTPGLDTPIVALLDARMGEVYGGVFAREKAASVRTQAVSEEWMRTPLAAPLPTTEWLGIGQGFAAHPSLQPTSQSTHLDFFERLPEACYGLKIAAACYASGKVMPPHQAQPIYLRNRVAEIPRGLSSSEPTA